MPTSMDLIPSELESENITVNSNVGNEENTTAHNQNEQALQGFIASIDEGNLFNLIYCYCKLDTVSCWAGKMVIWE